MVAGLALEQVGEWVGNKEEEENKESEEALVIDFLGR